MALSPFFSRHALNAAAEAVDEEDEEPDLLVVVEDFEELATPPQAAATRATVTIADPMLRRCRFLDEVARRHTDRSGINSWSCCLDFIDRSPRDDLC